MSTASPTAPDVRDRQVPSYASLLAAYHEAYRQELASIVYGLPWQSGDAVLDVCCGDGFFATLFAEGMRSTGRVVAVDASPQFLKTARRRARRTACGAPIETVRASVYRLPFDDDAFGLVWCAQSLISLANGSPPHSSRAMEALSEMRRVLRPGGTVALLEYDEVHQVILPWPADLELAVQQALRTDFRRTRGSTEQLEVGRHLTHLLREAGFDGVERVTHASDRQWPLNASERTFVEEYLDSIRLRARSELEPIYLDRFDRLTDQDSTDLLIDQPDFEMTCLDMLCIGRKPD